MQMEISKRIKKERHRDTGGFLRILRVLSVSSLALWSLLLLILTGCAYKLYHQIRDELRREPP